MGQSNKMIDAFLSHNSKDKPIVKEIGRYLEEKAGLTVFLDEWNLIPGEPWQEELERALSKSRTCVCFIGEGEPAPWHNEEMRAALNEMVTKGSIRVVPVLLPGAKRQEKESMLPMFLRLRTWVEFKKVWNEPDALHRLVCGIKAIPPGIDKTVHATAPVGQIQCPFRGLEVFREEDREFFFGREAVVQRLMGLLNRSRFLAIVGPSGVGKSSIVQAGLIPLLRHDSLVALFTPRTDPIEELAFALYIGCTHDGVEVKTPVEEWVKRLKGSPDALHFIAREVLERLKNKDKKRLILAVDQFEELFTQSRSEEEKRRFIAMVLYAVEKVGGPVTVIVTMRSDFIGKCAYYPDLNVYMTDYLEQIEPMSADELRTAVEKPALAVGLEFEEGLLKRILDYASSGAGELPLVEHALLELFKTKKGRCLTMSAYTRIGGISGALAQRAEGEYEKLSDKGKEILRNMFVLRLVQPGDGTEDTRRRTVKEELLTVGGDREVAGKILKEWTDARLLTVIHDRGRSKDMVDVAHEALIRKWDRVRQWIEERREVSRQVGILRQAVWKWEQSGKNPLFLYEGAQLVHLEGVMDLHSGDLTETEKEFIRAGVEKRKWKQRKEIERLEELLKARRRVTQRSRVILVIVMIALVGMSLWYMLNKISNNAQRKLAMKFSHNAHWERGDVDSLKKLHWLVEAAVLTPDRVFRNNYLLDMNGLWNRNELVHLFKHEGALLGFKFNRDWKKIITWSDDYTARLWEIATGTQIGEPMIHDGLVIDAVFNSDGTKVLTWSRDETARLWETATGKQIGEPMAHDSCVSGAVFNRDGSKILIWNSNTARLWEVGTGKALGDPMKHDEKINGALFNRSETMILTWSDDKTIRLWESGTCKPIGELITPGGQVIGVVFNRDGSNILTWSDDYIAQLWETGTGKQIGNPMAHGAPVKGAVFNRDETRILTWEGQIARLWEVGTGKQIGNPMTHDRSVLGAMFNRDETTILTWSEDGTTRLWVTRTEPLISPTMRHNGNVLGAVFNRDETTILTWSDDKTARLWETKTGKPSGSPMVHNDKIKGAVFNRDETTILTWSDDKTARLWEAKTGRPIGSPMVHNDKVKGAVFNRDGTMILTWSADKTARLWEAGTGKQIGPSMKHIGSVKGAVFNRDETKILTWSSDGTARLRESGTGKPIGKPMTHIGEVNGAVFNRDETKILTWSSYGPARLWEAGTGKKIGRFNVYDLQSARFNFNETKIFFWGYSYACLWEVRNGKHIGTYGSHFGKIRGALLNHNETKILIWSEYGTARLEDTGTGNPIVGPMTHGAPVNGAVFNRDETKILTWSADKTSMLWDTGTGNPIGSPMTHDAPVNGAVFNRDETKILTWSEDGTARLWDIDVDYDFPLDLLKLQIAALTGTEFNSSTGEIIWLEPKRFEKLKAEYLEKAAKHYQSCKYKKANIFHRFYPHWPKK